jgi:hypothetical protein
MVKTIKSVLTDKIKRIKDNCDRNHKFSLSCACKETIETLREIIDENA